MKKLAALRHGMGRDLRTVVIAAAAASAVTAAPAVAEMVANADKVDGKDAVSSGASVEKRKGALVATSRKTGRLPNNIIAKALDADRFDGLDSIDLRVTAGGKAGDFVNVPGCGEAPLVSYPVEVERKSLVSASAAAQLSVPAEVRPTMFLQLLDAAGEVVARSQTTLHSGGTGNHSLEIGGVLFSKEDRMAAFEASPGAYTLSVIGDNWGLCDNNRSAQYQNPQLSHLLVPVAE